MVQINKFNTSPSDVKADDWCALKIVAVAGYGNDWACYVGPTDWSDEHVASNGNKVSEEEASIFAYLMQLRSYRS
jgi:hypothetical protein